MDKKIQEYDEIIHFTIPLVGLSHKMFYFSRSTHCSLLNAGNASLSVTNVSASFRFSSCR
ncbi:hypothetical protein [Bacteroides acidifaciens]|uniref:hypothetical protein n=1 Tax=Bacteroides acidifaciens TaxID=85831 RepID=UPI00158AFC44|nr:hypothetical protein [Bacteroides acidifaciens]